MIHNRDDSTSTDTSPQTTIYGLGNVTLAGGKDSGGQLTAATEVLNQSALIESGKDVPSSCPQHLPHPPYIKIF